MSCNLVEHIGAHAVLFHRKSHTDPRRLLVKELIEKKPFKLVAVALANKMARTAFAILRGKTTIRKSQRRREGPSRGKLSLVWASC